MLSASLIAPLKLLRSLELNCALAASFCWFTLYPGFPVERQRTTCTNQTYYGYQYLREPGCDLTVKGTHAHKRNAEQKPESQENLESMVWIDR